MLRRFLPLLQTDELLLGDLIEGEGIEVGQRIGDRQRQANLLFDKGSAIGAGNRLAAREEGEIAALATILLPGPPAGCADGYRCVLP